VIVNFAGIIFDENNEIKVHTDEPIKIQGNFIFNKIDSNNNNNFKCLLDYYTESTTNKNIITIEDEKQYIKSPAISPVKKILSKDKRIHTNLQKFECPSKTKIRKLNQSNENNTNKYYSLYNDVYFIKNQESNNDQKNSQKIKKELDIG